AKIGDRWAALEPIRQGMMTSFGSIAANRRLDHRRIHPQPAAPRDPALNRHAHHPVEHRAEEVALQELPQADEGLAVGHRAAAQAAEVPVRDAAAYFPLELLVAPALEMLEHQQP